MCRGGCLGRGLALHGDLRGALILLRPCCRLLDCLCFRTLAGRAAQLREQLHHAVGPGVGVEGETAPQHLPLAGAERFRFGRLVGGAAGGIEGHAPLDHLVNHDGHRVHIERTPRLALMGAGFRRAVTGGA